MIHMTQIFPYDSYDSLIIIRDSFCFLCLHQDSAPSRDLPPEEHAGVAGLQEGVLRVTGADATLYPPLIKLQKWPEVTYSIY